MPRKGQAYLLKNTTKARVKIGVVGQRAQLAYKDLAKASAQAENTKLIRGIREWSSGASTDGAQLKAGVLGMADRLVASTEQFDKISKMDPDALARMYDTNDLTLEVFFSYEGLRKTPDGWVPSAEKQKDIDWFIQEYERVNGVTL